MKTYVLITYEDELPRGFDASDLSDFIVSESAGSIGGFHPDDPAFHLRRSAFNGQVVNKPPKKWKQGGELDEDLENLLEDILRNRYGILPVDAGFATGGSAKAKDKSKSEPESSVPRTLHPAGSGTRPKTKNVPDEN